MLHAEKTDRDSIAKIISLYDEKLQLANDINMTDRTIEKTELEVTNLQLHLVKTRNKVEEDRARVLEIDKELKSLKANLVFPRSPEPETHDD